MLGFADQPSGFFYFFRLLIGLDHRLEHVGDVDRADLVLAALVVGRDHLAERDRALHRLIVTDQLLMQPLLGQCLPAPHDLGCIVDLQLIILVFQQFLQAPADDTLFNREYQYLVVCEQTTLDRFREVDNEQFFAVERFVIHRAQGNFTRLRLDLGTITVDSRRCRHVQALC